MIVPLERLEAVLLSGAAGDSMGGPFEGHAPDAQRVMTEPPWRLSDDTRLTFATCRAIARAPAIDPKVIAEEFLREYQVGLPGVGSSTLKALRDLAAGQHWALAGARGEFAAGNGPSMRAAPLAFCGDVSDPEFLRSVRDVARITHANDEAAAGALAVVAAMQWLADRGTQHRTDFLRQLVAFLPDTALSDSLIALAALPSDTGFEVAAQHSGTSGRTAHSIALAIFIGGSAVTIQEAIMAALRAGGDTDTIAAVSAQLRAASGETISSAWESHLPVEEARAIAKDVAEGTRARVQAPRRPWWRIL